MHEEDLLKLKVENKKLHEEVKECYEKLLEYEENAVKNCSNDEIEKVKLSEDMEHLEKEIKYLENSNAEKISQIKEVSEEKE